MDFIHLHNHSDYSILDGAITIDKMIKKAIELKMPAIALTDHGNMFGAIEFYQKSHKAGITPIIGEEFYYAPTSRLSKELNDAYGDEKSYHLLMLAKNETGYKNLMKLSSVAYTEGFYYKPRIDLDLLQQHSEGLICSSACLAGQIPNYIMKGKLEEARKMTGIFNEIFGKDHFYLELQDHGIPQQKTVNTELIKIASEFNIPLIATNDAHYTNKDDAYSHEVLLAVQTGKTMQDENRMRFYSNEFYLKTQDEMAALFPDHPDAITNTYKIFEMIDLTLDLGNPILPNFEVPEGYDLDSYLRHLVLEGAKMRYNNTVPDAVLKRIDYELSVITSMHFSGYFLIVWDFINYARKIGVPVGPGRGSAAGSMVSYCLEITALDPLKYDLLFERFLNPDRNEMPDMDLDFCADRREDIIDYVRQKYGTDHVSQIITFNKMKAKAVIKDVARVMDIPFARANEISKMIDDGETLGGALDSSKEFKQLYKEPEGKELIDISMKLEGLVRSAGKHAAGVVISRGPLTEYVPLYKEPKEGSISSQYEKNTLEQAGLVKMDFLGLKNLSIIDKCLKLIKRNRGIEVDIEHIPLDDSETFTLFQQADTKGVFQLESGGMQNILRRLRPTAFEDIIAIVALYRPGPLESGMADDFIKRKRKPELVAYPHPTLEPILKDTLGVVVYQEQVMLISQIIAGFTLPEADKLRKAMGKKKEEIINELEEKFLEGAEKKNIDRKLAEDLYSMIKKFGRYGFNKSHSAAYALVTYQTAYLKAHYRIEYMTALMSAQPDKTSDVIQYINDCKAKNIHVLPPTVNESEFDFTVEGKSIRFGLGAIKGIGGKAIDALIESRNEHGKFNDFQDFVENVDSQVLNKGVLEALIKSGAFDQLVKNRAQLFASIDIITETAKRIQQDKASGQGDLFSFGDNGNNSHSRNTISFPDIENWHDAQRLANEKEVVGLYLSGHPLSKFEKEIRRFSSISIANITEQHNGNDVALFGIINDLQVRRAQKSGRLYAMGVFEDLDDSINIMMFSKTLEKYDGLIKAGVPVLIKGSLDAEDENQKKIIVRELQSLKDVRRQSVSGIHIKLDPVGVDDTIISDLRDIVADHKGDCPLFFHVNERDGEKIIKAHSSFNITPSEKLVDDLATIVGQEAIRYSMGV